MSEKRKKRELSEEESKAAARLKSIWWDAELKQDRRNRGITQHSIAKKYKITQGAVSHYINGEIALNMEAVLMFAHELRVKPIDIYPELFDRITVNLPQGDDFLALYERCPPEYQESIRAMMRLYLDSAKKDAPSS